MEGGQFLDEKASCSSLGLGLETRNLTRNYGEVRVIVMDKKFHTILSGQKCEVTFGDALK